MATIRTGDEEQEERIAVAFMNALEAVNEAQDHLVSVAGRLAIAHADADALDRFQGIWMLSERLRRELREQI